jgi:hypothetical protein
VARDALLLARAAVARLPDTASAILPAPAESAVFTVPLADFADARVDLAAPLVAEPLRLLVATLASVSHPVKDERARASHVPRRARARGRRGQPALYMCSGTRSRASAAATGPSAATRST